MNDITRRLTALEAARHRMPRHDNWTRLDYAHVTESERQELAAIRRLADEAGTLASLTDEQVERAADLIERCQGHRHSRQSGVWT
jgi:hypothetical protein